MHKRTMRPRQATTLQDLLDREGIKDCLYSYCRAIDRRDRDLLEEIYWPEATDDHVIFSGSAGDFINWVIPQLEGLEQSAHALHNIFLDLAGNQARVETYFTAYHRPVTDGKPQSYTLGGRYLDVLEKRGGEWRILRRKVAMDWLEENPAAAESGRNALGITLESHCFPTDVSYEIFDEALIATG